jgi:dephospho-CoA kinase
LSDDRGSSSSIADPVPKQLIIGLTGPIAAGKSTVAALLSEHGAFVIDADRVYQSLLEPGSALWRQLRDRFGHAIVTSEGVDRSALGNLVFDDARALRDLERISHPAIAKRVREEIGKSNAPVIAIEAVKLIQSELYELVDCVWLVNADRDVRLRRLQESRGLDASAARARLAASDDVVPTSLRPDAVIDNSRDIDTTRAAVESAWQRLTARCGREIESEKVTT